MKRLVFHRFGPPAEVLGLEPVNSAPLVPCGVRLKLLAAPVNPADLNYIEGTYGVKPELPAVPGIEGCGEVLESRDPRFAPGDRAIFLKRADTWAEETTVPGDILFKLPPGLDPLQAAMLKVNPATAWQLLTGFRSLEQGAWVALNAANSGVGRCVIQLARTLGLRTVAFVRRPELIDELKALGADHVALDGDDGLREAKEIVGSPGVAVACNAVGGESALRLMNLLAGGGVHVTYGAMARRPLTVPNGLLIFKNLELRGLWITRWIDDAPAAEVADVYTRLAAHALAGELVQPVDAVFPLEAFPAALVRAAEAGRHGKVLFRMEG
jgi:NADPH:quinone reductase-like Zn-dependent oxidoreductase